MKNAESAIKILAGEKHTPFALAESLNARCILESSSYDKGKERYSVLLVKEAFQLVQDGQDIMLRRAGQQAWFKVKSRARDILDVCLYFANQHTNPGQGFPFPAGGIGYLSYEFARFCDNIHLAPQKDPLGMPDAAYLFGHIFIVVDHYTDLLYLIGLNYREASIDLEAELDSLERRIRGSAEQDVDLGINFKDLDNGDPAMEGGDPGVFMIPEASDDDESYKEGVARVRQEVVAGNLLQGVLSRRLSLYTHIKALEAYRHLRSHNPSPYLFYLDFGNYQLFGSSPEVHVKIRDGEALLRPIAGTRRRGKARSEDLALEAELLADPKERAEHLMLVDLGRNDLGRVCKAGSVRVTEYMTIERYSHVMHIVSQVEGELAPGRNGLDALRATFPAGTVSGAPKIRAMEILSRLEGFQRRFYAGAVGYMEPLGDMDTCIAIRTGLKVGKQLVLQAGAGIVYDSTPQRELEETKEKMSALLRAIGLDPDSALRVLEGNRDLDDVMVSVGFAHASAVQGSAGAAAAATGPRIIKTGDGLLRTGISTREHWAALAGDSQDDGRMLLDLDFDLGDVEGSKDIQAGIDTMILDSNLASSPWATASREDPMKHELDIEQEEGAQQ